MSHERQDEPSYPDWEVGDDVPDGFEVYDGDGESGPCEPHLIPIEMEICMKGHGEQRVVQHLTVNVPYDPTAASKLECGCIQL